MWTYLPLLSNAMCTCHRLQVVLRIEVTIIEYNCVSSSQIEALSSTLSTQQKDKRVCIVVEFTDSQITFFSSHWPIQPLIRVICHKHDPKQRTMPSTANLTLCPTALLLTGESDSKIPELLPMVSSSLMKQSYRHRWKVTITGKPYNISPAGCKAQTWYLWDMAPVRHGNWEVQFIL